MYYSYYLFFIGNYHFSNKQTNKTVIVKICDINFLCIVFVLTLIIAFLLGKIVCETSSLTTTVTILTIYETIYLLLVMTNFLQNKTYKPENYVISFYIVLTLRFRFT